MAYPFPVLILSLGAVLLCHWAVVDDIRGLWEVKENSVSQNNNSEIRNGFAAQHFLIDVGETGRRLRVHADCSLREQLIKQGTQATLERTSHNHMTKNALAPIAKGVYPRLKNGAVGSGFLMAKQKTTTRPRGRKAVAKAQSGSGARTILLLQTISEMNGDFALSELAKHAGLPASSVHRILQPLVRSGFVARSQGSAYRIGYEYYRLAAKVLHQIEHEVNATPFLRPLWRKWQETAVFCLFRPAQRYGIITEIIQSPHPLRHVIEPFASISLPWGSLGRAILAQLKPAEVAAIRAKASKGPVTGSAGPELKALLAELTKVRENGFAVYRNQNADLAGVAAPVFRSGDAVIGSIGVTMPVSRFDRLNIRDLCQDVVKAAAALGRTLGHIS